MLERDGSTWITTFKSHRFIYIDNGYFLTTKI